MDTAKIREAFFNAPEKVVDVPTPDWLAPFVEPTTQLGIQDVPTDELSLLRKQAEKDSNGNDAVRAASLICACLINRENRELIFQPTDRDTVAHLGSAKLTPLLEIINEFFGFTTKPVENAKKN